MSKWVVNTRQSKAASQQKKEPTVNKCTYLSDQLGGVEAGVVRDDSGQLAQSSGERLHRQGSLAGRSRNLPGMKEKENREEHKSVKNNKI